MITGYQVRTMVNGEEVLILYIRMDEEFSLEWFQELKQEGFQKFIKNHRIFWNGTKVFLVVGGITLAVLKYQPQETGEVKYISDTLLSPLVMETCKKEINLPLGKVEVQKEEKEQTQEKEKIQESSSAKISEENPSKNKKPVASNIQKPISKNQVTTNKNQNSTNKQQPTTPSKKEEPAQKNPTPVQPPQESAPKEPALDTEKYVTIYRKNGQVQKISVTDYLIGVVAAEMPASFQMEALKTQSIVARTYMMKAINTGKKLTDTVSTQSYIDVSEMKKMWGSDYATYYKKIQTAVLNTKDLVITYQGSLIDAVYHSTSNGKTENSENVWKNAYPYLKSVDSSWDKSASSYFRSTQISKQKFLETFHLSEASYSVQILSRNESGRVSQIQVGDTIYSGVEFRNKLGLRSADFDITLTQSSVQIDTRGYGHGVGFSQYGANGMAKEGSSFAQILKHYYQGVEITTQK